VWDLLDEDVARMLAACPQQVVRVVLVEFGERHDTRTNGQHYTAADRRPTNQIKLEFHDTDTDIIARILADSPDTPTSSRKSQRGCRRECPCRVGVGVVECKLKGVAS